MASDGSLTLEVVTPLGVVLSEKVDEVVAPSVEGEFGVLPGHLPMLAALNTGLLHFTKGNHITDVAVGTGFAEVLQDKTLILTDRYATSEDVDVLDVRERLTKVDGRSAAESRAHRGSDPRLQRRAAPARGGILGR
ncbi:MAG: ATP synthase F1 subunit epsilon [Deltaproteobacteria bacterium]|nr:ATP synthase F1 subunit epsilon [Deltaproteobacteria bacterium]